MNCIDTYVIPGKVHMVTMCWRETTVEIICVTNTERRKIQYTSVINAVASDGGGGWGWGVNRMGGGGGVGGGG